jgi:hypothetical protein
MRVLEAGMSPPISLVFRYAIHFPSGEKRGARPPSTSNRGRAARRQLQIDTRGLARGMKSQPAAVGRKRRFIVGGSVGGYPPGRAAGHRLNPNIRMRALFPGGWEGRERQPLAVTRKRRLHGVRDARVERYKLVCAMSQQAHAKNPGGQNNQAHRQRAPKLLARFPRLDPLSSQVERQIRIHFGRGLVAVRRHPCGALSKEWRRAAPPDRRVPAARA